MAILEYDIVGNNTGLNNAVDGAIKKVQDLQNVINAVGSGANFSGLSSSLSAANNQVTNLKKNANDTSASLQFQAGITALDALGKKLLIINGNAELFGSTIKNQTSELGAYQTALNSLLSAGFEPLDADVLRLKDNIDRLTASIAASNAVPIRPPVEFPQTATREFANSIPIPGSSISANDALLREYNADLAKGAITAEEYAAAVAQMTTAQNAFAKATATTLPPLLEEEGLIGGLKKALADLKTQQNNASSVANLPVLNREIQETEAEIARLSNVGKTGFDAAGNSVAKFGGGLRSAFGGLRQLAYILPGIGIAGIFNLAFEAVGKFAENINFLGENFKQLQTTLKDITAVEKDAADKAGAQIAPLKLLYNATQDVTRSIQDRTTAAQQLRELYPEEFANSSTLAILNGELSKSYDELSKAIINNARSAAARDKIGKLEGEVVDAQLELANIEDRRQALLKAAQTLPTNVSNANTDFGNNNPQQQRIEQINEGAKTQQEAQQKIIKQAQSTEKILLGFVNDLDAAATALDKANKFLGKNLENFNALLIAQKSEKDLQNIQSALKTKLAALTPSDAQFSKIKDDLQKVDDLLKKYQVKPTKVVSDNAFDSLNKQLDEIFRKTQATFDQSGLTGYALEVQKITDKYKEQDTAIQTLLNSQKKLLDKGKITPAQFATSQKKAQNDFDITDQARQKELSDAAITEAKRVKDEIQRINDEFGIRAEQSRSKELAQIQARYDVEVVKAKGNKDILTALDADRLSAIDAVNAKYLQKQQDLQNSIKLIDDQAKATIQGTEESQTAKITKEWEERRLAANKYYEELKLLAVSDAERATIKANQAKTNSNITGAENTSISAFLSKPFSGPLQSSIDGFISNFANSIISLGATREAIDQKYALQLAAATDQSTIDQINNIKRLELASTTSFQAIFGNLVSSFNKNFSEGLIQSFSKKFTENLGTNIVKAPDTSITSAGTSLATSVNSAATSFYTTISGAASVLATTLGTSSATAAATTTVSAATAGVTTTASASTAGTTLVASAQKAGAALTTGDKGGISAGGAGLAALASIGGSLISGATAPTSTIGQTLGGALSGAGTGALIGSVIPGIGTAVGAVVGGLIGGISGLFSSKSAQEKAAQAQAEQLEQEKQQTALLKAQLDAYTTQIIGRMTAAGVITGVSIGSTGQLVATVSGQQIQFVLNRNAKGR